MQLIYEEFTSNVYISVESIVVMIYKELVKLSHVIHSSKLEFKYIWMQLIYEEFTSNVYISVESIVDMIFKELEKLQNKTNTGQEFLLISN